MSEENVEGLKRAFDAFAKGDLETAFAFIDPAFEISDRVIGSPSERGPDALIANAANVREAVGDVAWEPREIVDLGDRVLVRVHVTGAGRHTSLPIDDDPNESVGLTVRGALLPELSLSSPAAIASGAK